MNTTTDLGLGDIAVEVARLRASLRDLRRALYPRVDNLTEKWNELNDNIDDSLDRLHLSADPADLEAVADMLHSLYRDVVNVLDLSHLAGALHPPRGADLSSVSQESFVTSLPPSDPYVRWRRSLGF